jgi:hypothetical protein
LPTTTVWNPQSPSCLQACSIARRNRWPRHGRGACPFSGSSSDSSSPTVPTCGNRRRRRPDPQPWLPRSSATFQTYRRSARKCRSSFTWTICTGPTMPQARAARLHRRGQRRRADAHPGIDAATRHRPADSIGRRCARTHRPDPARSAEPPCNVRRADNDLPKVPQISGSSSASGPTATRFTWKSWSPADRSRRDRISSVPARCVPTVRARSKFRRPWRVSCRLASMNCPPRPEGRYRSPA